MGDSILIYLIGIISCWFVIHYGITYLATRKAIKDDRKEQQNNIGKKCLGRKC